MADKLSIGGDVRELKLGASFTNNKSSAYHTIKYDFKPASVDVNKMATVDVGTNNQVTVTVPHLDGAGVPHTVFKGNQRSYSKECVLIIDRVTGQITLEKLSSNIQVKKTRQETNQRPALGNGVTKVPASAVPADVANVTQRSTSRTRVASGISRRNTGSSNVSGSSSKYGRPTQSTPPTLVRSPPRVRTSPPQAAPWSGGQSTLASLPMIGLDDNVLPHTTAPPAPTPPVQNGFCNAMTNLDVHSETMLQVPEENNNRGAPQEDASSSSSSSGSDSDSDQSNSASDSEPDNVPVKPLSNGVSNSDIPQPSFVNDVLNNDLRLSESESDSD